MVYLFQGDYGGMHCRKLKEMASTQHIPVLLNSAYPNIKKSVDYFGCDDFIAKPFDIEELVANVITLLTPKFVSAPIP